MSTSKKDLSWQGAHKLNPSGPQHEARCSPACRRAPSTKAIAPCPRLRSLGSRGRGSHFPIDPDLALGIRISRILSGVVRDRNGQAWLAILRELLDLPAIRSEEHTSELQSLMRISYAVFCLKKKTNNIKEKQ